MNRLRNVLVVLLALVTLGSCSKVNSNKSKKAILVVSFGTSYIESREKSLDKTRDVLFNTYPEYDGFRAFTSQIIIDVYKKRDNINIMNVDEAINKIYKEGYGEILVVPTLIINGEEYDEMIEALRPFQDKFSKMVISKPLLTSSSDYDRVTDALIKELPVVEESTAIVYMGHGTPHFANSAYPMLDYVFKHKGYNNIYVGTVEGTPTLKNIIDDLKLVDYQNILLMPLMMVAGDHAHNDLAGDESDSWKMALKSLGYNVDFLLNGIGELPTIQQMFVEHSKEALEEY